MIRKRLLLVLDFDGLLLNSYALLRDAMASYGLDVSDEERFKNRRKFLKYLGGGKELLNNLEVRGGNCEPILSPLSRLRERAGERETCRRRFENARLYGIHVPLAILVF